MERFSDLSPSLSFSAASSNIPSSNSHTNNSVAIISALRDATLLAESTINSLSFSFFNSNLNSTNSSGYDLAVCPFDRHHRMPPESLFSHFLSCSSSPGAPLHENQQLQQLLKRLHYIQSLKSTPQSAYLTLSSDSDAGDVCFSLDDGIDLDKNSNASFFYKDCPAVVSFSNNEAVSEAESNKTFLLPSILLSECANVLNPDDGKFSFSAVDILPSEYWALKRELEAWNNVDFPTSYSYIVLLLLASGEGEICRTLSKWILCNSSQYGIVIDTAMRDHLLILSKLCLKAVRKEACASFKSLSDDKIAVPNLQTGRFDCIKLVDCLSWLAAQLSILYGETNGKLFAVGILKQTLLCVGSESMFKSGQSRCEERNVSVEAKGKISRNESVFGQIFVSQVAAAISALHERRLLEDKLMGLRFPKMIPKSELVAEYSHLSTRAQEIRESRPNYKAIPEHDGIIWQRGNNQDSSKPKSREELLAEERDYKRRRMSYRGKKVNRNPTEVLRDIIEEHMDELKHAGGTEYSVKSTERFENFPIDLKTNNRTLGSSPTVQKGRYADAETKQHSCKYGKPTNPSDNDGSRKSRDIQNHPKDLKMNYCDHQQRSRRGAYKDKNSGFIPSSIYNGHSSSHDEFAHDYKEKTNKYRSKSDKAIVFEDRYDPSAS